MVSKKKNCLCDMKSLHNFRKKHIIILSAVTVLIMIASSVLLLTHFSVKWTDEHLKARDIAQTSHEMAAARKTLTPLLNPLSIELSPQNAASCSPGDTSLYAHSCGTKAEITYADAQDILRSVSATVDKLQKLDTALKSDGWVYTTNDFRSQNEHPLNTWANSLQSQGITISYHRGTCNFEIIMPSRLDMYQSPYLGSLSCYIDSGPASI